MRRDERSSKRTTEPKPANRRRSEAGDTLIEVLLAVAVLGIASVALLIAFATSMTASAEHRGLATTNTVLVTATQDVSSIVQKQASAFTSDQSAAYAATLASELPKGYTLDGVTVEYWNTLTGTWTSAFIAGAAQLITYTIEQTSTGDTFTDSVVVQDPQPVAAAVATDTATQFVFVTQPGGATYNSPFAIQPVVYVEDSDGNIVTSNLSPITMTLTSGPSGAVLSGCTGIETAGVVTWSGCTINMTGAGFEITVSAPGLTGVSLPFAVTAQQLATPGITNVLPSTSTAGAVTATFTGSLNAPSYSAIACTNAAMSTGCVTITNYTSGAQITGLVAGTDYYVQIVANGSSNYLAATSLPSSAVFATVQLNAPSGVIPSYGATAGSVNLVYAQSNNAPGGQTYTAEACTGVGMTGTCFTNSNFPSPSAFTGLNFSPGFAGTKYWFTVKANLSIGYLASPATTPTSQSDTSQMNSPTAFVASSSATTPGVVAFSFTASSGTAPANYTVEACTSSSMTLGCQSQTISLTVGTFSGLTPGTSYYVGVVANTPNTAYVSSSQEVYSASVVATVQLSAPTNLTLAYGSAAGSIQVSWTAPGIVAPSQTYTVKECSGAGMTGTCNTNANFTSGSNWTGLSYVAGSPGSTYYFTVVANGSTGYLVSPATSPVSHAATSQIGAPGTPTVSSSTSPGAITATFASSSGTAPASYTAEACTNTGMSTNCVTQTGYTSGAQLTGLTQGLSYFVQITANPPTGYTSNTSAVSAASAVATVQLSAPTNLTLAYGSAAGSIQVSWTAPGIVAPSQTYTVKECSGAGMTGTCNTNANFTSGSNWTGLSYVAGSPGSTYYFTVVANGSTGYLVSPATSPVSHAATSVETTPAETSSITGLNGSSTGKIQVQVTTASVPTPNSYTCNIYSNVGLTNLVVTGTCVTASATTFSTGLGHGSTVWIAVTSNSTNAAYLSVTSAAATGTTK